SAIRISASSRKEGIVAIDIDEHDVTRRQLASRHLYCKARRLDASTKHMRRTLRAVRRASEAGAFGNCDHKEVVEMRLDFCRRHDPGLCARLGSAEDIVRDD